MAYIQRQIPTLFKKEYFVIKARISVDSAAIIKVLATYSQMHNIPLFTATVLIVNHYFVLDLICSLVAGGLAYFYQTAITLIC